MAQSTFIERFTLPEFNAFLNVWHVAGDDGDHLIQTMAFAAMANHARLIVAGRHDDWSTLSPLAQDIFVTEYIGMAISDFDYVESLTPPVRPNLGERIVARLTSAIAHLDAR